MSKHRPASKQELIEYVLRKLGEPVIKIDVTPDQLCDRFEEAYQYFSEYHSDASFRTFIKHQVTAQNIIDGYIPLTDDILSINQVFTNKPEGVGEWSAEWQYWDKIHTLGLGEMDLTGYVLTKQYLAMIDQQINGLGNRITYNRHLDRLFFDDAGAVVEDQFIVLEVYQVLDKDVYNDIFNDIFFKRYLTELVKQQWGQNLSKWESVTFPGGMTIDKASIIDSAREGLEKLETEIDLRYSAPPGMFIG
jgi:hypothetical protein